MDAYTPRVASVNYYNDEFLVSTMQAWVPLSDCGMWDVWQDVWNNLWAIQFVAD